MKRFLTLLLAAAMCFALAACHKYLPESKDDPAAPPGSVETADPAGRGPLALDALNVEFVAGGRDADELLKLKSEFPRALTDALAKRDVAVGAVNVTFGTSDEATAEALQSGAVDLGFLPAEAVIGKGIGIIAVERNEDPDLSMGVIAFNWSGWEERELANYIGYSGDLVDALFAALPDLAPVLTRYTGEERGGHYYICESDTWDELDRLYLERYYNDDDTVLHTETAAVDGRGLTLNGMGHQLNEWRWGIRAIEVWDGDTLLQTIEMTEAGEDAVFDGDPNVYTMCWTPEETFRAVDANFDGCDDIEVFGWIPSNTIPYFYWLWNPEAQKYEYSFPLQGPTIDPESKTLTSEYKDGPGGSQYWIETYEWQNGELVMTDRVDTMAGVVMH